MAINAHQQREEKYLRKLTENVRKGESGIP